MTRIALFLFYVWVCLLPVLGWSQTVPILGHLSVSGHINTCSTDPVSTATGPPTTYACALDSHITSLLPKACYGFVADVANAGTASINFSSLGAKTITKAQGGITTALAANDIRAGMVVHACWDGTQMQCQNCFGNTASLTTLTLTHTLMIPAGSMDVSGGCISNDPAALLTNGPRLPTVTCIDDNAASIEFAWDSPSTWNAGTVTVQLKAFNSAAESTALVMRFAGQCVSSGDAPTAHSTSGQQTSTVTWTNATNRVVFGSTSSPITLQGSCVAGDTVFMRGQVDLSGTTVASMATVKILSVKVEYTIVVPVS